MAQELHLLLAKDALVAVKKKPVVPEAAEDLSQVVTVVLYAATGDQEIIQVDKALGQIEEYAVHEPLKHHTRILQAKWHTDELKKAKWRYDRCLC
jgi:hypothetical protein